MSERRRLFMREIAVAGFFLATALLMTWPLALHLSTAVHDPTDPYVSSSIIDWDLYALGHHPSSLFDLPVFFPSDDALAFTEHLFGIALVVAPFRLLGFSAIALHSIAMILGFAFCGYGGCLLGRTITGSTAAGVIGGLFYAFVPYRFHHLTHISYVWSGWLPLLLASLIWYAKRPSLPRALTFGAVFFFNGLTCLHWLAFGSVAIALTAILLAAAAGRFLDLRWWVPVGTATMLALIVLAPWLLPYRRVARLYGMQRSWADMKPYSARWSDWFMPPRENRLYGDLVPDEAYEPEHPLFPGLVVIALAAASLLMAKREDFPAAGVPDSVRTPQRRRGLYLLDAAIVVAVAIAIIATIGGPFQWQFGPLRVAADSGGIPLFVAIAVLAVRFWIAFPLYSRSPSLRDSLRDSRFPIAFWCAVLWVAIGIVGSFGINSFFHETLFRLVPLFRGIRVPLRWSMVAYVGLSAIAAAGMLPMLRSPGKLRRTATAGAVALAILLECRAAPIEWTIAPDPLPPVYQWLSRTPFVGGVTELPIGERISDYEYLLAQTIHHHPLVNGVSSFVPARYATITALAHENPIRPEFVDLLERIGCSLLVVHVDDLYERRPAVRKWLAEELSRGRLTFVRRFDHKLFGDYVFAVTRNCHHAEQWRAPEQSDPAGRTPSMTLQYFLDEDGFTYNESTFGQLGVPSPGQDFRGTLTVWGWTFSPRGIRAVNLLLDNGRIRVPATLSEAASVVRHLPWYPRTTRPQFTAAIPFIPHAGRRRDIQVEVIDGRGQVTRLDDVQFRWSGERGLEAKDWNTVAVDGLLARVGMNPAVARQALLERKLTIGDLGDRIVADGRELSDSEFVDHAFAVIFSHSPDATASHRWTDKLARGAWRRDVIDGLIRSEEFERDYLAAGARMETLR